MAAQKQNFSSSVEKHFMWALLSNCFLMNLKFQNIAQWRFVFVVALRDFLERSLRVWIIHE